MWHSRNSIWVAMAVLAVLFLGSGCTFYRCEGRGPKPRTVYAQSLHTATATEIQEWTDEAKTWQKTRPITIKRGAKAGYTLQGGQSIPWIFLAGTLHTRYLLDPSEKDSQAKRRILSKGDGWGFLAPLFVRGGDTYYDRDSGACLGTGRSTCLTLLIWVDSRTVPKGGGLSGITPAVLESGDSLDDLDYDHMWGCAVAFGAIGFGAKNDRAYFQIVWIPIPLW